MSLPEAKPAAIILAAGESRRMGQAKALLPFRDGTFVSVLGETLGIYCEPVFAVFGFDAQNLMAQTPHSVVTVENPLYREGMLTSLQAGLRAMRDIPERVLFTLVDHPAISGATISALLDSSAPIAMPRFEGKRGHPVSIAHHIALEIVAEPITSQLNHVMDRHVAEIHYIDVDDPGVGDDIDDPKLYQDLLAREGIHP